MRSLKNRLRVRSEARGLTVAIAFLESANGGKLFMTFIDVVSTFIDDRAIVKV